MSCLRHINVLVVGETGTGKSSIINLIFNNENLTKVSVDAKGCTNQCSIYEGSPEDYPEIHLKMYDTIGIEESDQGTVPRKDSLELFDKLFDSITDGIHLLLFSIKMGRLTKTVKKIYDLFYSILFNKQMPCLLVITHCEFENEIGHWWKENEFEMKRNFFEDIVDAISITTIQQTQRGLTLTNEYNQSRIHLINSILNYSRVNQTNIILKKDLFHFNLKKLFEIETKLSYNLIELSQKNMSLPHLIFFIDFYPTNIQQINDSKYFYQKLTNDLSQKYSQMSIRSYSSLLKSVHKFFPSNSIQEFHPQPGGSISIIFLHHQKEFHQKIYLIKQQIKKFRSLINQLNEYENRRFYLNENPYENLYPNLKDYNQQLHSIIHLNPFKFDHFQYETIGIVNEYQIASLFQSIQLIIDHLFNQYNLNE